MATDLSGGSRRSAWLVAALAVLIAGYAAMRWWPGGAVVTPPPRGSQPGSPSPQGRTAPIDPAELNVRIEALEAERPTPGEAERNPFRFKPKPPPPAPPPANLPPVASGPPAPTGPPPPPAIELRFMGVIDHPTLGKVAAFSDCKGFTVEGQEGKIMDGRYRVVKIGVESVVIEYANGTGRRTLPLSGCPPR